MKLNKQLALLITLVFISLGAYLLIPNFEREEFNTDIVEEISTGTISTTTTISEESENLPEENLEESLNEVFKPSIYDTLLINNKTERIEEVFETYLIIGSDERSEDSSASRGSVTGSRADVIMLV